MSDERDPLLSELFHREPEVADPEDFAAALRVQLERLQKRRRRRWLALELLLVLLVWLLAEPLQEAALAFVPWLMSSLVQTGDGQLSQLLAPVNNLASVLALLYLIGRSVYRRLLR